MAQGGGEVDRHSTPMARLREVAMTPGPAGADLGGVLGEGDVAEVVQRLDAPVPPDEVSEAVVLAGACRRLVTA
jgi:hypothetical protein